MAIPSPGNDTFVAAVRKASKVLGKEIGFVIALIPEDDQWTIKLVRMRWNSHPTSIIDEVAKVEGVATDQRITQITSLLKNPLPDPIICCRLWVGVGSRWSCLNLQLEPIVDAEQKNVSVLL